MPTMYLIRGLPGSGKSTLAKKLVGKDAVFENDHFFVGEDGVYRFDPTRIKAAVADCLSRVLNFVAVAKEDYEIGAIQRMPDIAVANTFVKRDHMDFYVDLAYIWGYQVIEIVMQNNLGSIHNVPRLTIERMRLEFEY